MELLAGTGSNLRTATERSVTLLRVFLLASACIIAVGGILLSSALTRAVSDQAVADSRSSVSQYVDGVLRGELVRGGQVQVTRHTSARLTDELRHNRALVEGQSLAADRVLAWTNGPRPVGRRFDMDGDLGQAVARGARSATSTSSPATGRVRSGSARPPARGYADPLANGRNVLGVYEIYADPKGSSKRSRRAGT